MSYSSVLFDGKSREHLFSIEPPRLDGKVLTWLAEPLQCEMTLRRRAPAYETTLFDSDDGGISWLADAERFGAEMQSSIAVGQFTNW